MEIVDEDDKETLQFQLQGEMSQITSRAVTWHQSLALGIPEKSVFEVQMYVVKLLTLISVLFILNHEFHPQFNFTSPNYKISHTANGVKDITSDLKNALFYLDGTFYNAAIEPLANGNGVEVLFMVDGKGICVNIRGHARNGEGYLSFNIGVPKSFYNRARGILGHFDGNKDTELYHRNSMSLIPTPGCCYQHIDMESCEFLGIISIG